MAKPAKSKAAQSVPVLSFAEITSMKQTERLDRFKLEANAGQRAFAAMAKLFRVIEANLKNTEGIYPMLQKLGVKKGTISNASYAAKVFDLVEAGVLNESEFDTLSFNDCFQIVRVQSGNSKKRLSREEIALAIRESNDFAEDFSSLYEHGKTAAEKREEEKSAKEAKEIKEKEEKAKAEKDAADLKEAQAEAEQLKKQLAEAQASSEPAEVPTLTPVASHRDESEETSQENQTQEAPPALITSDDVIALLNEVELAIPELCKEDQEIVAARIVEMADQVIASGIIARPIESVVSAVELDSIEKLAA